MYQIMIAYFNLTLTIDLNWGLLESLLWIRLIITKEILMNKCITSNRLFADEVYGRSDILVI